MKISAVIVAGGKGKRMGAGINKVLLELDGKAIIARTMDAFQKCPLIDEIIVVTSADDAQRIRQLAADENITKLTAVAEGGKERSDSVYNGLLAASGDIAAIHDGARCLVTNEELEAVINDCIRYNASALGVTVKDTLKTVDENGSICGTIDREHTVRIQTPQVFYTAEIRELHERIKAEGVAVTDDCSVFEHYGKTVHVTVGRYENIKITTPEDMAAARDILRQRA